MASVRNARKAEQAEKQSEGVQLKSKGIFQQTKALPSNEKDGKEHEICVKHNKVGQKRVTEQVAKSMKTNNKSPLKCIKSRKPADK